MKQHFTFLLLLACAFQSQNSLAFLSDIVVDDSSIAECPVGYSLVKRDTGGGGYQGQIKSYLKSSCVENQDHSAATYDQAVNVCNSEKINYVRRDTESGKNSPVLTHAWMCEGEDTAAMSALSQGAGFTKDNYWMNSSMGFEFAQNGMLRCGLRKGEATSLYDFYCPDWVRSSPHVARFRCCAY